MSLLKQVKDVIQGKPAGKRSSKWGEVRGRYLKEHPSCAVCGHTKKLEVHHKLPFHLNPELELDVNNLITLCETKKHGIVCHLLIGHLGNYKTYNPEVETDAKIWNIKLHGLGKST